jgi:hypothetical protein
MDLRVGDMTVLSIVIVVAMELMINMHIVVDVVGEKLIFVAATSAQATLSSYGTPHLRCFVRHPLQAVQVKRGGYLFSSHYLSSASG